MSLITYNDKNNGLNDHSGSSDIPFYQDFHSSFSNRGEIIQGSQEKQQDNKQKKKKCHGNRKLQRYRRKLRDQGMDSHMINELVTSSVDMGQLKIIEISQQNEQAIKQIPYEMRAHPAKSNTTKKDKRKKTNKRKQTIVKKKKISPSQFACGRKVKVPPVINDSVDYTTVPDEIFSEMSSAAFSGVEKLDGFLNEDEKIKFTRRYTSLIDRRCHLQLQECQWKHYYHLGTTQNIWMDRKAKHWAEKYSICYTYGRSKNLIQQRLKQIEQHLTKAHTAIQQFEDEILSKRAECGEFSSAMRGLSSTIHQFVYEKQRPLQHEFEYKRQMLILDAVDHQLVQKFFNLEPNKSHINIAKRIWQTTMKQMIIQEDVVLLEKRLSSTQLQWTANLVHQMIDSVDRKLNNLNQTLATSPNDCLNLFDEAKRLKALKSDIVQQAILTSRGALENLNAIIQIEQNKFSVKNRYMESTAEWQKLMYDAIEIRRLHMIERATFIIKHKLAI